MEEHATSLIYVADPMCSWCYGFSPEIEKISQTFGKEAPIDVIVGGLRPWTQEPWTIESREAIQSHWQTVATTTGQSFDFTRFEDHAFIYDTEPACRAVTCMRAISPTHTLPYLRRLHVCFYADGLDTTNPKILADVASEYDIDPAVFLKHFESDTAVQDVTRHFQLVRHWGISGYPTLLVRTNDALEIIAMGYRTFRHLQPIIRVWLDGRVSAEGQA